MQSMRESVVQPFFGFSFPAAIALPWCQFQLNDNQLLTAIDAAPQAVFYGSITGRQGVVEMLEYTGMIKPVCIVCRTSNGIVESWLKRFNAQRFECAGHRPRYLLASPEWMELSKKVWRRSVLKAVFTPL